MTECTVTLNQKYTETGNQVLLGFSGLLAPMSSHIAFTYESENDRQNSLFDYIITGLENQEKCIAAVSEYTADFWTDGLRARGIEPETMPDGQLEILTAGQLFHDPIFEPVHALANILNERIEASLDDGWRGVRICTGFTHLYHQKDAIADILAADSELNDLVADRPITLLCTFAKNKLHPRLLEACLRCHPLITDGTSLNNSDDYLEPEQLAVCLPDILRELDAAGALAPPFALLEFHDGMPVIRTGDELDICTSPQLEELANWIISVNHGRLVVDLSGTSFMDAASIGTLARIALALDDKGGRLAIYDPLDPLRKIFQLVKLQEHIPVRRELEKAVEEARGTGLGIRN